VHVNMGGMRMTFEEAYEAAIKLSGKHYARVTFEYEGFGFTVEPHRLARKIHDMERGHCGYCGKEGELIPRGGKP
jgi:hypothetical protein